MSLLDPRQFLFCLGGPTTNSLLGTMPDSLSGTSPIRSEGGGKMTSSFRISDILHSQTEHNTSTESEPRASSEECRASPLRGSPLGEDSLRGSPPSEHSPNGTKKARKARTIFTDKQLQELENTFDKQKYLSVQDRMDLAHRMGLSDTQVKTWYQNRRTKWKRQASTGMDLLADAGNMAAVQQLLRSNPYWSGYMGGPQNSLGGPQLGGPFAMGPNIPLMMGLAPNFPLSFPFMLPTSQPPKDSSPPINVSSEE